MVRNIFGREVVSYEKMVEALIEGSVTEGECLSYEDDRGDVGSTLRILPSRPNIIFLRDSTYGSRVFSINDVEEAVDTFMGYVEMRDKNSYTLSSLSS